MTHLLSAFGGALLMLAAEVALIEQDALADHADYKPAALLGGVGAGLVALAWWLS